MTIREDIVREAESWLRTPYHHQGQVKGAGVDCAMLLVEVYHTCGLIPKIDPRPYPPDWHLHRSEERYLSWVEDFGDPVDVPLPGDVVLFKFGRCFSHGAIVVNWPVLIHAQFESRQCCYGDGDQPPMVGRERVFYRIKGIDG